MGSLIPAQWATLTLFCKSENRSNVKVNYTSPASNSSVQTKGQSTRTQEAEEGSFSDEIRLLKGESLLQKNIRYFYFFRKQ